MDYSSLIFQINLGIDAIIFVKSILYSSRTVTAHHLPYFDFIVIAVIADLLISNLDLAL